MASDPSKYRIDSFVTAPLTPFTADMEVNYEAIGKYIDDIVSSGCTNVFLNGTTGECFSLTMDERFKLAEAWVKEGKDKLTGIIVHVSAQAMKDVKALAAHSEKIGATAIACMAPCYHKPSSEEALAVWMKEVSAAAPNTPLFYYDINFMTGVKTNQTRLFDLMKGQVPTLCGMKDSSRELPDLEDCRLKHPEYQMLIGTDNQFAQSIAIGVTIPVSHHFLAPFHARLLEAMRSGDLGEANKWQERVLKLYEVRLKYGTSASVLKAMLRAMGSPDLGLSRLPADNPTPEQVTAICEAIEKMGFKDWTAEATREK